MKVVAIVPDVQPHPTRASEFLVGLDRQEVDADPSRRIVEALCFAIPVS